MLMPVSFTGNFKRLEPYDGKLSSPVLRGWRKWQRFLRYPTLTLRFLLWQFIILMSLGVVLGSLSFASDCGQQKKEGFRIFVSFSMPKELLVSLDQQAKKIGAKLVIRGLKNNSFKETFEYAKSIGDISGGEQSIRVDIDPKAFDEFEITQVPSFVVNKGGVYDKLTGNVSIAYVLNEFAGKGDLKEEAVKYLKRLENENK